jgi:hypothetical protein
MEFKLTEEQVKALGTSLDEIPHKYARPIMDWLTTVLAPQVEANKKLLVEEASKSKVPVSEK